MEAAIVFLIMAALAVLLSPFCHSWRKCRDAEQQTVPPVDCEFVFVPCAGECSLYVLAVKNTDSQLCAKCFDAKHGKAGAA